MKSSGRDAALYPKLLSMPRTHSHGSRLDVVEGGVLRGPHVEVGRLRVAPAPGRSWPDDVMAVSISRRTAAVRAAAREQRVSTASTGR